MPDVKLGNLELVLAKDSKQVRAFQFLHAVDEPGEPGRVGTIVFDQLHHGPGAELALAADRYIASNDTPPNTFVPGVLSAADDALKISKSGGGDDTGSTGQIQNRLRPSSFQSDGDVYFVLYNQVLKVPNGTGDWTVDFAPTTKRLEGVPAFYGGKYWLGLADLSQVSRGHVHFDGFAWTENELSADNDASFFLTVHGGLFCVERTSLTGAWKLKFSDAANPELDVDWVTIVTRPGPWPTGIASLGRFILVFGEEGEVIAVSDAPPVKNLVEPGLLSGLDKGFAHGSRRWGSDLMVLSDRGLFALNIDRLAGKDVSPINVQGHLGNILARPTAVAPFGADFLVGMREEGIWLLRRYPEGVFYNHLLNAKGLGLTHPLRAVRAMEYLQDTGVLTVLIGTTEREGSGGAARGGPGEGRIASINVPDIAGSPPGGFAAASTLDTSSAYGPFAGRKLALQVRGVYPEVTLNPATISVIPDLGSPTVAGTLTAKGPFALVGARVVGTTFGLRAVLPAGVENMIIGAGTSGSGTGATVSFIHNISTGGVGSVILLVYVSVDNVAADFISAAYAGSAMTLIDTIVQGGVALYLFAHFAPATGAGTVVVTPASAGSNVSAGAVHLTGAALTNVLGPGANVRGTGLTPTITVKTAPDEVVVAGMAVVDPAARTVAPGTSETESWEELLTTTTSWGATQSGDNGGVIAPTISGAGTPSHVLMGVSVRPNWEWPRLLLPLMLDYAEEPRAGDRIRIAVEAPAGQRRADAGGVSVEKFLKDLRDLRNSSSTITLTLLDVAGAPSTFTVLVEAVSSVEERPALKREFPSAVAFIDLRVV